MAPLRYSARNKNAGNRREFFLNVNPIVFHAIESKESTVNSLEISPGIFFYMSKNYRLQSSKDTAGKIAATMAKYILKLVMKEAQRLISFWYNNVNMYFNRRSHGLRKPVKPKTPQRGKVKTPYIANTQQHTGQLRRSLIVSKINIFGAELYAKRVHAKTNNVDYIAILMRGASGGPRAYIPHLDLRIKGGRWGGIPSTYWRAWQTRFDKEVMAAETRLNNDIIKYVEKMKVLSPKEIRASRNTRHNKEYISNVTIDERNMSKESAKSKYKRNQGGQDPIDAPWEFEDTWEGMKTKFYGEAIPNNNLSWTAELNDVIRANNRRMSGRRI